MTAFQRATLALLCALPLPRRAQTPPVSFSKARPSSGFPLEIREASPKTIKPGMLIGPISLEVDELYDARVPREAGKFGRAANRLHILTHENVVRRELLFQEGDRYSRERIAQTERNLRDTGLFIRVRIYSLPPQDGRVPILVRVQDAWSLQISADFGRAGGVNSHSIGIKDNNVLGSGITVSAFRSRGFQIKEEGYGLGARRIFGTHDNLTLHYATLQDGRDRLFSLEHPFFAIDSPDSHLLYLEQMSSRLRLYQAGVSLHEYRTEAVNISVGGDRLALQTSERSALRLGGGWSFSDQHIDLAPLPIDGDRENLPESLRIEGPFFKFNWVHENFRRLTGILHPGRDQDFNLGFNLTGRFIFSSPAFGGGDARGRYDTGVAWGFEGDNGKLLMVEGGLTGDIGRGRDSRQFFKAAIRAWQQLPHNTLRAGLFELRTTNSQRWVDNYYLGGSPGLRGYPENQFRGPHSVLAVAEIRRYFNWTPLNLMQTGVVAFAESGAIWGGPANFSTRSVHGDVGVGMRFAILKISGNTLIKIDFAAPIGPRPPGVSRWQTAIGFRGDF